MQKLLVITTGGTIDKVYFDAKSEYQIGEPVVTAILQDMRVGFDVEVKEVCKKDSLELTDEDRQHILEAINSSETKAVLITHGTDTMVETARYLGEQSQRTIVLTGAMQPAAFKDTDGIFNIGVALGILNTASPGVYVAMNGRAFTPDAVVKNYGSRRFEAV